MFTRMFGGERARVGAPVFVVMHLAKYAVNGQKHTHTHMRV